MRVLIVDAYHEPPWAGAFFTPWIDADTVVVRAAEEPVDDVGPVDAIVVTGSRCSVNDDLPWIDGVRDLVARAVADDVPVLGVCWGHQLLASAVGVPVVRRDQPEIGFLPVELDRHDPVVGALPARFRPFVVHEDDVPAGVGPLEPLGRSEACALHAFRVRGRRAWGVQFHLEYPRHEVVRILEQLQAETPDLGLDPAAVLADATDLSAHARTLFDAFLRQA